MFFRNFELHRNFYYTIIVKVKMLPSYVYIEGDQKSRINFIRSVDKKKNIFSQEELYPYII